MKLIEIEANEKKLESTSELAENIDKKFAIFEENIASLENKLKI